MKSYNKHYINLKPFSKTLDKSLYIDGFPDWKRGIEEINRVIENKIVYQQ